MKTPRSMALLGRWGYGYAVALTIIGGFLALGRYLLPHDLHLAIAIPLYGEEYATQQLPTLASMPATELVHRVGGTIYFIIGLLQFSKGFRTKRYKLHRQLGRVFLVLTVGSGITAFVLALLVPFSGFSETVAVLLFGGIFAYGGYMAYVQARRRNFRLHQEWILRSYTLALSVVTTRAFYLIFIYTVPVPDNRLLDVAIWLAFSLHLLVTEWYIQKSRPAVAGQKLQGA